jgi:hypothetical protein
MLQRCDLKQRHLLKLLTTRVVGRLASLHSEIPSPLYGGRRGRMEGDGERMRGEQGEEK